MNRSNVSYFPYNLHCIESFRVFSTKLTVFWLNPIYLHCYFLYVVIN